MKYKINKKKNVLKLIKIIKMSKCGFCGIFGHNIRACEEIIRQTPGIVDKFEAFILEGSIALFVYLNSEPMCNIKLLGTRFGMKGSLTKQIYIQNIMTICYPGSSYGTAEQQRQEKMRQHNISVENSMGTETSKKTIEKYLKTKVECSVCLEYISKGNIATLSCGHEFCAECVIRTVKSPTLRNLCALCREPLTHLKNMCSNDIAMRKFVNEGIARYSD